MSSPAQCIVSESCRQMFFGFAARLVLLSLCWCWCSAAQPTAGASNSRLCACQAVTTLRKKSGKRVRFQPQRRDRHTHSRECMDKRASTFKKPSQRYQSAFFLLSHTTSSQLVHAQAQGATRLARLISISLSRSSSSITCILARTQLHRYPALHFRPSARIYQRYSGVTISFISVISLQAHRLTFGSSSITLSIFAKTASPLPSQHPAKISLSIDGTLSTVLSSSPPTLDSTFDLDHLPIIAT